MAVVFALLFESQLERATIPLIVDAEQTTRRPEQAFRGASSHARQARETRRRGDNGWVLRPFQPAGLFRTEAFRAPVEAHFAPQLASNHVLHHVRAEALRAGGLTGGPPVSVQRRTSRPSRARPLD